MKKINSTIYIMNLVSQIHEQLDNVEKRYLNKQPSILTKNAADGGWSITQCLEHLNTYSAWYHKKIREKLAKEGDAPAAMFTSRWPGSYFIRLMSKSADVKKYRAMKMHIPLAALDANKVLDKYLMHQRELLELLKLAEQKNLNKIKIPLSFFPVVTMNLGDTLNFLAVHQERHLLQAKRNFESQQLNLKKQEIRKSCIS